MSGKRKVAEKRLTQAILSLHECVRDEMIAKDPRQNPEAIWHAATGAVLVETFINVYSAMQAGDDSTTIRELVETALEVAREQCERAEGEA